MIAESGRKALLERALRDALTGAFNRSKLNEIGPSLREGTSIIMIDLDQFKALNDGRGHFAGDQALRLVAAICTAVVGPHGSVVRMGGDEFICLLPATGFDEASSLAACIRERYTHEMKATVADFPRCSLSVGVARGETGKCLKKLLRQADRAMYRMKAARTDRSVTELITPVLAAA